MTWEEFCNEIDRMIHKYGNFFIPIAIFFAALVFIGIGYLATHRLPQGEEQNVSQDVRQ
ncbi:MAG: hypothetical protein AAB830_02035 [Patescibacteria group bacterium]